MGSKSRYSRSRTTCRCGAATGCDSKLPVVADSAIRLRVRPSRLSVTGSWAILRPSPARFAALRGRHTVAGRFCPLAALLRRPEFAIRRGPGVASAKRFVQDELGQPARRRTIARSRTLPVRRGRKRSRIRRIFEGRMPMTDATTPKKASAKAKKPAAEAKPKKVAAKAPSEKPNALQQPLQPSEDL